MEFYKKYLKYKNKYLELKYSQHTQNIQHTQHIQHGGDLPFITNINKIY